MSLPSDTTIELSRRKLFILILVAFAFVALGAWMLSWDEQSIRALRRFNHPALVYGVGVLCMVFFGAAGLYAIRKAYDRRPGLIFTSSGIVDQASGVAAGLIPWSEIDGASVIEIHKQKMLVIRVRDPQQYLARGNALKRMLRRANHRMYGSPVVISAAALKIDFAELLALFERYLKRYGG